MGEDELKVRLVREGWLQESRQFDRGRISWAGTGSVGLGQTCRLGAKSFGV